MLGVRHWAALLGFWLCAFVISVTLYEFWRGAMARHRRSWRKPAAGVVAAGRKNRRRYGGYIIHLGVVLMALGIIGIEIFQTETQGTIPQGESITLGSYASTYDSLASFDTADGRNVARAVVSVYKEWQIRWRAAPPPGLLL